ncbi:MAG: hypothetical protein PF904_00565 [Kiritimatiellae bacterium]|nr:hypothetical protein [Kiritimatiellia bacterium]
MRQRAIVSSRYNWSAPCVEVINRYRGRPQLPIGVPKGDGAKTNRGSPYAKKIAEEFPCTLKTNADAPSAVEIYRHTLATAPDHSVTMVTVGYLTNLRNLMESKADQFSTLKGSELIRLKVFRLVCMGGRYPEHLNPSVFGNFKPDPASAVAVSQSWPGPIYFSGMGEKVMTGRTLPQTPENNPARRAYKIYLREKSARPSWDQVTLLFAVRPNAPFWKLQTTGYNHIFKNGTNQWRNEPNKNHVLVSFDGSDRAYITKIIETLMTTAPAVKPGT